ncbi:DUF6228 family protein [Nocardia sp. NPDC047654]|uniref:DUF6228 family protein n=1 Tax=Nocardia sp. NPDC047654 TaxID=3364314 RepID=UPI0037172C4B
MGCEFDLGSAEDGQAVELIYPTLGSRVRIWNRIAPYDDEIVAFCAELSGEQMRAAVHGLTVDLYEGSSLARFLDGLAAEFTGWSGIRIWESLDRDLRVEAQHHARGYVEMTWTLSPHDCARPNTWSASVVTGLEAGEEMRRFAVAVHRFLQPS